MMMKKIFLLTVSCLFALGAFPQQSEYLQKYRTMALEYNYDLKAMAKNIAASMELEKMARADMKPKLSGGADFQYTGNPMELTLNIPALGAPQTFQGKDMKYGASVSLLQPIYTGGKILEAIKVAQHQQSLAVNQAGVVRSAVCFQTDVQYWNTVARMELVGVATDSRNSMAELVQIIKERVEVGLVDPQDLLMAEVKLNEAEYRLLEAKNEFETGRMALNSMIGVELRMATEVEASVPVVIVQDSLFLSGGNVRPEVKMAQDHIKMAESELKLNDANYKPQLFVGADGHYSAPGYNFRSDLDPNYAVYAKLSIPIFEWGKRKSEKRMSTEKMGIAADHLNKVEDDVQLEVETARVALLQTIQRIQLAGSSLEKANENERKSMERYSEGKVSILEVIDAQAYRQTSQVNYTQAKVSAQGYYSELIRALNGYDFQ